MSVMNPDPNSLWGRLVKSWATSLDYITDQTVVPTAAIPADIRNTGTMTSAAFNTMIANVAGHNGGTVLSVPLPAGVTTVVFVQNTADTVYINLPPASAVASADQSLMTGGVYGLPDFEIALYGLDPAAKPVNEPAQTDVPAILTLTANHIGDYVVAQCART